MSGLQSTANNAISAPPKSIVNKYSTTGFARGAIATNHAKPILSGTLTLANTLYPVLTVTSAGVVHWLSFYENDNTSRSIRCRVTVDGTVVFDSTTTVAVGAAGFGGVVVGAWAVNEYNDSFAMPFNNSLLVELASSNAGETNTLSLGVDYWTV